MVYCINIIRKFNYKNAYECDEECLEEIALDHKVAFCIIIIIVVYMLFLYTYNIYS